MAINLNPLLFIVPGIASHSQNMYVRSIVDTASKRGYDVAVINYRGLAGADLMSPRLFHAGCHEDILEPMKYIYEKYGRGTGRKVFAIGCSMGGGILANLLGSEGTDCFLDAASCVAAPLKSWVCR